MITLTGCLLGRLAAGWAAVMLADTNSGQLMNCPSCGTAVSAFQRWLTPLRVRCPCRAGGVIKWHIASMLGLGGLFALFSWLLLEQQCQTVHEVRPDSSLLMSRLPFHLTLIFLLWVSVLTDLLDYVIPDELILLGIPLAVVVATWSGELQLIHIWVNWDEAIPGIQGPYLPDWMKNHHHLHGLAWSLAGMACGASTIWLIRWLSHRILGYPAMGLGDATLMGMAGAFLGWQPILCVVAIAPITGVVVGVLVRLVSGRSFVAYGPYLACSTVLVMCTWRWLWADYLTLRDIFSHWPSVAGLVGFSFAALSALLVMLRLFRTLPVESLRHR
ncbi:MAG: prepilin peptidase [Fuerstiella sp.]